jgi:drug/metabolite transporter (DMT)-like permease
VRRVSNRSAALAAFIAFIWGLCFVLIQASLPSPTPLLLAALRALIGGGVLASWAALRSRPGRLAQDRGVVRSHPERSGLPPIPLLIALAVTNAALAFGAMYLATARAEAGVASILAGGQPLVLAFAGWALFGERLSGRTVTGLAVAMAGVVVVATTSSGATSPDGVALALLATAAPAAGTVLMRRLAPAIDLLVTTSAQFLLGGAFLLAASALIEPWDAVIWSQAMLTGLLVLGVLGTGLAYVAWFWLLDRISLVRLGAALFLVPVVGIAAAIVAGERPEPVALAGIAVMLVGLGIVSLGDPTVPSPRHAPRTTERPRY